ncbi:MAG: hypothetical protein ACT6RN_16130 [Agrobacterium sp.]
MRPFAAAPGIAIRSRKITLTAASAIAIFLGVRETGEHHRPAP